jgi:hypothetical protein
MSRWFRVYDDILDDPKVQMLSPELFRAWVNLLAVASRNAGKLPAVEKLAFALRCSVSDMQSRLDDLIMAGLIDILADGTREPHNWSKRQWKSDDSAERVRKHRAKKHAETSGNVAQAVTSGQVTQNRNADVTVTVTPPDTDTDTDIKDTPLPPDGGLASNDPKPTFDIEALKAFEAYNARALVLGLPQASRLTPDRKRRIVARLRDFGTDGWARALANLDTPFLRGRTDHRFRADLDFVCQPKSFARLHDGGYAAAPVQSSTVGVHDAADRPGPSRHLSIRERTLAAIERGSAIADAHFARLQGSG